MEGESVSAERLKRLHEDVGRRLLLEGWTLLQRAPFGLPDSGTCALPLEHGFAATFLVVDDLIEDESGAVILSPVGLLGLDYEPARQITTALTGLARSGVVLAQPTLSVALPDTGPLSEAAASLVRFAVEWAGLLKGDANVDTLVEMLRQRRAVPSSEPLAILDEEESTPTGARELPDPVPELIAALLAGAGRHEEARRALSQCKQPDPLDGDRENARFVRQLTRWIEHPGKLTLPKTPAEWPPHWAERLRSSRTPSSFGQVLAESMPSIQARQKAVQAVRSASAGKSRDELRALLRDELSKRDVHMRPVAFEQTLAMIATEREPFGKARIAFRALGALRDLGHQPLSSLPADPPDDVTGEGLDEDWVKTPERAAYPIRMAGSDRVAVELDPAAAVWLDRLMAGRGTGATQTRSVEVWLDSGGEPAESLTRLSVHIGSQRIGHLDVEVTRRLLPAMQAAAERDEDPWVGAHLTRIPHAATYVLDVPLPEG